MSAIHEMNNLGVVYFEQGDLQAAFSCFREGLQQLRLTFQQQGGSPAPTTAHNDKPQEGIFSMPCSSLPLMSKHNSSCDPTFAHATGPSTQFSYSSFPVHTQAFFVMDGVHFSSNKLEDDKIISAFLIFNNALVYHLQGMKNGGGGSSRAYLQRALAMYQQVVLLLQDYIQPVRATGNAAVDLLCMAVLNNIGLLLLSECLDLPASRNVFGQLALFAHSFQHVHGASIDHVEMNDETNRSVGPSTSSDALMEADDASIPSEEYGVARMPSSMDRDKDERPGAYPKNQGGIDVFQQVSDFLLNATILTYTDPASAAAA